MVKELKFQWQKSPIQKVSICREDFNFWQNFSHLLFEICQIWGNCATFSFLQFLASDVTCFDLNEKQTWILIALRFLNFVKCISALKSIIFFAFLLSSYTNKWDNKGKQKNQDFTFDHTCVNVRQTKKFCYNSKEMYTSVIYIKW